MRYACLDLPALPLQLLWRKRPAWKDGPAVVVEEDRPQGKIVWACDRARACRVLPGQRYAHALSLAPQLRAAVVTDEEIAAAVEEIAVKLHARSPEVMRGPEDPGTFWLGGAGLGSLWPSATAWGRAIADDVAALGLVGVVVVGFSRFATYALARGLGHGLVAGGERAPDAPRASIVRIYARDAEERAGVCHVPLDRLDVDPRVREGLARLGVRTVGEMVRLPAGGVLERFGPAAHRLYQLAAGERWDPLAPEPPPEAADEQEFLDDAEQDSERLLFAAKPALDRLLARLAAQHRALAMLSIEWNLQRAVGQHERRVDHLRPAAPTLDGRLLLGLLRLRLEHQAPSAGVVGIRVWAEDVPATAEQLALFAARPRRDLRAADAAVARLRAELGDAAVRRAVLRPGHLPEAQYAWERLDHVVEPKPQPRPTVIARRIFRRARLLPPPLPHVRDDGWVLSRRHGPILRLEGPYVVSGGWWAREVHRTYHFAETKSRHCLWLYFDEQRKRWYHHGRVG